MPAHEDITDCRCCLLHAFTLLWERVGSVAAACEEDPRLGTVPMVEKWLLGQNRTRELCRFGRGVELWNLWTVPPGLALGATLWLEMLPQFYNYCQSEETMGGMRWLSRSVRSSMAACLEGDRQAGQGILCLGLLYVLSDLVVGDAIRQLRSSLPPAFTSSHHPHHHRHRHQPRRKQPARR